MFYWAAWHWETLKKLPRVRPGQDIVCPCCGELHKTWRTVKRGDLYISCRHKPEYKSILIAVRDRMVVRIPVDAWGEYGTAQPANLIVAALPLMRDTDRAQ
jgi:hypothetical protein